MAGSVTIVSGSIGAGHDGVAAELARRLRQRGYAVERLDFIELLGERAGPRLRQGYATELATAPRTWGWVLRLLGSPTLARAAAGLTYRLAARRTLAALTPDPDLIVSVYPMASQVLGRLRRHGLLSAPVVTFLTDMSVHRLWVAEGVDVHLALHDVAADQALARGADLVQVCGAVVRPQFHPVASVEERQDIRERYAIPADRPAALVVAGSWGVGDIITSAADIAASGAATPVILCGGNTALREALTAQGIGVALGWVADLAPLIRSCDVVVQNAGGLTSLEAMACAVPVLSYRCLPGHGQTNAAALEAAGLARCPRDQGELAEALADALAGTGRRPPALVTADPTDQLVRLLPAAAPVGVAE